MTDATKKRILTLVERYGSARAQEDLAYERDASRATMDRHHAAGEKAWKDIGAELDKLSETEEQPK